MTGSDGQDREIWGTREELLLVCAVSRHGTQSWDSVAMEVRTRIPFSCLLTAQTCRQRYRDLQRRFSADARRIDGGDALEPDAIPLLEELRRLRVAELRREVERSLQLKVRRLEEDRECIVEEERSGDGRPDPLETEGVKETDLPASSPMNLAVDKVRGGDSGRSCNQSNSTEAEETRGRGTAGDGEVGDMALRGQNSVDKIDPVAGDDEKAAGEGSYNGSSDTVAKGTGAVTPAEGPAGVGPVQRQDAGESGESVAESKGEAAKESSDVQSSATLSRRRRGWRKAAASGGSSGAEEAEADEVSPVSLRGIAKSQPLASVLEIIWSHEYGPMFEHRLESQESTRYRSLVRQHMELATVRGKLAEGAYATDAEFYRDLLLLYTNAAVFFPRRSTEHGAAVILRRLVRDHMAITAAKPTPPSPVAAEEPDAPHLPTAAASLTVASKPETDPDTPGTPIDKTSSAPPLVACRKRSSISGKAVAKAAVEVKEEEKPETDKKELESMEKKRTKERSAVAGSKGLRTSKSRGTGGVGTGGASKNSTPNPAPHTTEDVAEAANAERKHTGATAAAVPTVPVAKKRSAVGFVTRMNRGPAGSNGALLQTLKASESGGKRGGSDQKRRGRLEARKEQGSRLASAASGTSVKQAQKQSVPLKRGVGRPPKRPPPPLPPPPAKRGKALESNAPSPAARAAGVKKRGRK